MSQLDPNTSHPDITGWIAPKAGHPVSACGAICGFFTRSPHRRLGQTVKNALTRVRMAATAKWRAAVRGAVRCEIDHLENRITALSTLVRAINEELQDKMSQGEVEERIKNIDFSEDIDKALEAWVGNYDFEEEVREALEKMLNKR